MNDENYSFKVDFSLLAVNDLANYYIPKALKCPVDFDLKSCNYHYTVDGKSIMGLLSLNLSRPVVVVFNDSYEGEKFKEELKDFVIE